MSNVVKRTSLRLLMVFCLCLMSVSPWTNAAAGRKGEASQAKQEASESGPVLDIPVTSYDLGVIKTRGARYQHDFTLLNVGDDVLEIKEVLVG